MNVGIVFLVFTFVIFGSLCVIIGAFTVHIAYKIEHDEIRTKCSLAITTASRFTSYSGCCVIEDTSKSKPVCLEYGRMYREFAYAAECVNATLIAEHSRCYKEKPNPPLEFECWVQCRENFFYYEEPFENGSADQGMMFIALGTVTILISAVSYFLLCPHELSDKSEFESSQCDEEETNYVSFEKEEEDYMYMNKNKDIKLSGVNSPI